MNGRLRPHDLPLLPTEYPRLFRGRAISVGWKTLCSAAWGSCSGETPQGPRKGVNPPRFPEAWRGWARWRGVLGAAGCNAGGASGGGGETHTLTYAYEQAEETSHGIAARIFKETLEEESGGAIVLQMYPAGQLGGEPGLLQKVLTQDIDFINSSTANASLLAPQAGVFSLHYLFDSQNTP